MNGLSSRRAVVWTGALAVVVLIAVTASAVTIASNQGQAARTPVVNNGGARNWVAFNPEGRSLGNVQFLTRIMSIVNTSTARNTFVVTYEPAHIALCRGTLAAGQMERCGVQPRQQLAVGYFQVRAARPVLMGGHVDVPVIRYVQDPPGGPYGADPSTGVLQNVPLTWQEGCPPRPGSGCPDGSVTAPPAGQVGG